MNWLKTDISIYKNAYSTGGRVGSVGEFLRIGIERKPDIEKYRKTGDKSKKMLLPCATISGTFGGRRSSGSLEKHSGLLAIDIDQKDNPDKTAAEIIGTLSKIPQIAYAARSVGGKGVWAIVPIAYPDRHTEQFNAIRKDFSQKYGIIIDAACKDVSRLRFCSYDDEAIIRRNPKPYNGLISDRPPRPKRKEKEGAESFSEGLTAIWADVICEVIRESGTDIVSGYANWRDVGFALARGLGESGRTHFHTISQVNGAQYAPRQCDRQYSRCMNYSESSSGITFGTFIHMAEDYLSYDDWEMVKERVRIREAESDFADFEPDEGQQTITEEKNPGRGQRSIKEEQRTIKEESKPGRGQQTIKEEQRTIKEERQTIKEESKPGRGQQTIKEESKPGRGQQTIKEGGEPSKGNPKNQNEWYDWLFGYGKYERIEDSLIYFHDIYKN